MVRRLSSIYCASKGTATVPVLEQDGGREGGLLGMYEHSNKYKYHIIMRRKIDEGLEGRVDFWKYLLFILPLQIVPDSVMVQSRPRRR